MSLAPKVRQGWGTSAGLFTGKSSKSWQLPQSGTFPVTPPLLKVNPVVAQPWGILSSGLTGGRLPPGWTPSRSLTDGKKNQFYTHKSITQACGAAPLLPFQRTITFSNDNKCLLHRGWVWGVELCAHGLCSVEWTIFPSLQQPSRSFASGSWMLFFCQKCFTSLKLTRCWASYFEVRVTFLMYGRCLVLSFDLTFSLLIFVTGEKGD